MTAVAITPTSHGPGRAHHRFRYGPWRGGPDPLQATVRRTRAAIDRIGQDVLSAGTVRDCAARPDAPRCRMVAGASTGWPTRSGSCARKRGDVAISAASLDQVRAALDQALAAERDTLAASDSADARLAELELDTLPDDVAGSCSRLSITTRGDPTKHARSSRQSRTCCSVRCWTPSSRASSRRWSPPDPEAMQRVKDMLADLNALLAAHARQEDTTDQFAEFMERHGEFFPEQPETIEELIDALARREAAAMRLMASLSPEQREQLGQLHEPRTRRRRSCRRNGAAGRQPAGIAS